MEEMVDILKNFSSLPIEYLNSLVSLGVIGVAGLAIYVVHAAVKDKDRP